MREYDLIVVGGGSGGIGAALSAARLGARTLLLERAVVIGGTAVRASVCIWEPGVGGTGIAYDIYRRLAEIPQAVGIYSIGRHCLWPGPLEEQPYPGGESVIDPERTYADTLRRHGARSMAVDEAFCREHWHGVPFEPDVYQRVVREMLAETGCCDVRTGATFADVVLRDGGIEALVLQDGERVAAHTYVDATGDAVLCVAAGSQTVRGRESRARYDEPHAPLVADGKANGVTLIYRVRPCAQPAVEPLPAGVPADCWWRAEFPVASIVHYPNGDLNINMLPTMLGEELPAIGHAAAMVECRRRVAAHWHHLQTQYAEFQRYRMLWLAPALGIRESRRVLGEYVLTEHDLLAGLAGQSHDDIIAIADHAMDTHGEGGGCGELPAPYGVPFRCLIPRGARNLLIACRAASSSALAASSCRLSRTMLALGQAAGTAAALSARAGIDAHEVPSRRLRDALRAQHVQLDWPMSGELQAYIAQLPPVPSRPA